MKLCDKGAPSHEESKKFVARYNASKHLHLRRRSQSKQHEYKPLNRYQAAEESGHTQSTTISIVTADLHDPLTRYPIKSLSTGCTDNRTIVFRRNWLLTKDLKDEGEQQNHKHFLCAQTFARGKRFILILF
jgi:hypothetical protein